MKLAIVHDYLTQYGGAERVVEVLHEIFPEAPIYTSIYLPEQLPNGFRKMNIQVSFMQKLPFKDKHFKKYLLLYPKAIQSFNLTEYEMVLSSSSAFAKGAVTSTNACHICYCYTPARFIWDYERYVERENFNGVIRALLPFFIACLRKWDISTVKGVDCFVSISKNIQRKIRNCYGRDSEIIYPPVDIKGFKISKKIENYFLIVSRLNAYKRIDLVIEAFNKIKLPLRIIGDGPYRKNLENLAGSNISFLKKVDEKILVENYSHCRALIFPGYEDFGLAPVEAQASGRPVIAYADGGALETVIDGDTGIFFEKQTVDSLIKAVEKFKDIEYTFDSDKIRNTAERFSKDMFKQKISDFIFERHKNLINR